MGSTRNTIIRVLIKPKIINIIPGITKYLIITQLFITRSYRVVVLWCRCQLETPALYWQPALLRLMTLLYWLFPSVPNDFTGNLAGNRHCSTDSIKIPLLLCWYHSCKWSTSIYTRKHQHKKYRQPRSVKDSKGLSRAELVYNCKTEGYPNSSDSSADNVARCERTLIKESKPTTPCMAVPLLDYLF